MNKKQLGRFIWNVLPVFAIIIIAAVFLTWQITFNHTSKKMEEKYTEIINNATSTNEISTMIYNIDSVIRSKYLGTVDEKNLLDGTITGYVYGLGDKYASYMTEEQYNNTIEGFKAQGCELF